MRRSTRLLGYAILLGIVFVIAELAAWGALRIVARRSVGIVLFAPPKIGKEEWIAYLGVRDPLLGWPAVNALGSEQSDHSGARHAPANPDSTDDYITLYGDSFTYADEVSDDEAWGNLLAKRFGCRVGNFGVSGYGTDQALLRFESNTTDHSRFSVLGIFPHNFMRNVNQYGYFLGATDRLGFKPRFILSDSELKLIPKPEPNYRQLDLLNYAPEKVLLHETFLPGTDLGPIYARFPYSLSAVRMLLHGRMHNWLRGRPSWSDFLEENHSSEALSVTIAIVRRFMQRCEHQDRKCFVLFFPSQSSYKYYVTTGTLAIQPVLDELDKFDIPYLALSPLLAERGEASSGLDKLLAQNKHFNSDGNRLVAEFVHEYIEKLSLGATMTDSNWRPPCTRVVD